MGVLGIPRRSVAMLSNTSVIRNVIKREINKWDKMYARRAFVHWYIGEGLEKNEMPCAV